MTLSRGLHASGGALLLVVVLGGCAASPSSAPLPSPTPATVSTPTETESTETPTDEESTTEPEPTRTDTPTPESPDPVAYVPWGPEDPVIPQHYGELARRDCTQAQSTSPGGEFWDAVIAVCRTLNLGAPWPDLSAAPAPPETDNPHERCLDTELAEMVTTALSWRAENGDARPEVTYAGTGSACYLNVYDAAQVPPDEDPDAAAAGIVRAAVVVDATYDVLSVSVDGTAVGDDDYADSDNDPQNGMRTVTVDLPAPDSPTSVTVELTLGQDGADRGTVSASVEVSPTSDDDANGTDAP